MRATLVPRSTLTDRLRLVRGCGTRPVAHVAAEVGVSGSV